VRSTAPCDLDGRGGMCLTLERECFFVARVSRLQNLDRGPAEGIARGLSHRARSRTRRFARGDQKNQCDRVGHWGAPRGCRRGAVAEAGTDVSKTRATASILPPSFSGRRPAPVRCLTMPSSFLIDRRGLVRFVPVGFHDGEELALEQEIKDLLKQ